MLCLSPVTTSETKEANHQSCFVNRGFVLPMLWETKPSLTIPLARSPHCLMQVAELTLPADTERELKTQKPETEYIIQSHLPDQLIPSLLVLHCRGFIPFEIAAEIYLQSSAQTLQIKAHLSSGAWIVTARLKVTIVLLAKYGKSIWTSRQLQGKQM